ncbi:MAG TPA: CHASE2 domain-containing protein [Kamptonema sp.]|nr:CHASE2 domain-containing protein [Kamptonema sp.]
MWSQLKKRIWKWRSVLIAAPSVAFLVMAAKYAGLLQLLELVTLDEFFRLRPREIVDQRIVIVTVDESDITNIGKWPISDGVLAQLIKNIKSQQPRAIGLDFYRNLPVQPGHQTLVEVFKNTPNFIAVEKVVGDTVPPPPALSKLDQVGIADLVLDADGKVRRALLSVNTEDGQTKLGLGTRLALMYLEKEGIALEMVDAAKMHLRLGKAVFVPFTENSGGYVRANSGGYQILLNFRGPQSSFPTISMTDVLKHKIPPELMRDRIVLIGATAPSLNDLLLTPYSKTSSGSPKRTPGVVIHANIISQILSAALEGRPLIRVWPDLVEIWWVLIWSSTSAAWSWRLLEAKRFRKNTFAKGGLLVLSIVLTGGSLVTISYVAFLQSWWIPVVSPLLSVMGSAMAIAVEHSRRLHRESEKRLAQFLEAVPVGVAVIDADGNTYYTNDKIQELVSKTVAASATAKELAKVYQIYAAGTNQLYPNQKLPIVRALKGEQTMVDDLEIRTAKGEIVPLECRATPVYDEFGNIAYAIATFTDITERKKAEAERESLLTELSQLNQDLEKSLDAELELTDAYGRFVPHEFLSLLGYESIIEAKLGDHVKLEMSILFSDIRDFTTMSESMNPEDNFKFINAYLQRMEPAITANNGFIDKYIGDAIMALFSGEADDAVKAAIVMLKELAEYNKTRGRPGRPPLQIGVGINTGSLMLGTVGGENRMNSTVISDSVNLASRMEGLTKNYGVSLLISHHTFLRLQNYEDYSIRFIDRVQVKGKSKMVAVYEVFDADEPEMRRAKLATKPIFEEGLFLYMGGDFTKAAQLFKACLLINPLDKAARIYLERSQKQSLGK